MSYLNYVGMKNRVDLKLILASNGNLSLNMSSLGLPTSLLLSCIFIKLFIPKYPKIFYKLQPTGHAAFCHLQHLQQKRIMNNFGNGNDRHISFNIIFSTCFGIKNPTLSAFQE